MMMGLPQRKRGGTIILLSILIALYLSILPMPDWAGPYRPPWAALILIYWCLAIPERVGVVSGWFIGLALDSLTGAMLGENALTLAVVAFICLKIYNRLRVFPMMQQALVVLALLLLQTMLSFWIRGAFNQLPNSWLFWIPPVIGAVIWPWLFFMLRDVRRRFNVA